MKNKVTPEPHKKWERIFEDDNTIRIWKYNSKISNINPYEVEIKYKNETPTKRTKKKGGQ